jgi:uncharacterized repeat protein (TIGR01451 family)
VAGANGASGTDGVGGTNGAPGINGATGGGGLTGAIGLDGSIGPTGPTGADGPAGPVGVAVGTGTTTLCVTDRASRSTVRQGGLVAWTIVVRNCGDRAASGVSTTDRLRTGATFKALGGGSLVAGQVRWTLGTLAPGAIVTYRIVSRFSRDARPGTYVNSATADGDNTRPAVGRGSTAIRQA